MGGRMRRLEGMAAALLAATALCSVAFAQEAGASAKPTEEKPLQFTLGLRVESWTAPIDLDLGPVIGFSESRIGTVAGLLTSNLEYRILHDVVATVHVGLGIERLRWSTGMEDLMVTLDHDPSFLFDGGLAGRYEMGAWDVGMDLDFRLGRGKYFGPAPEAGGAFSMTWQYWWFRPTLTVGWRVAEAIRPYVGLRYTYQDARFMATDMDGGGIGFKKPFGVLVGVELNPRPLAMSVEVEFVDVRLGLMASLGIKF